MCRAKLSLIAVSVGWIGALGAVATPTISLAQEPGETQVAPVSGADEKAVGFARINAVDRQRMLGEMMAKALCFTDLRLERKKHSNQLSASKFVFESNLINLTDGSEMLGLPPENRPKLISAINELKASWVDNATAINGWFGARWGKKLFAAKAYQVNLSFYDKLTGTIDVYRQASHTDDKFKQSALTGLLIAGRQRMLSQKFAKEVCQIAATHEVEANRERLKGSMALLEDTTKKLVTGDAQLGLPDEPPGIILDAIEVARVKFAEIEPVLESVRDGAKPTKEDLALVAAASMSVLHAWEKVVSIYEQLE